ncbi:hypothetical protein ACFQ9X_27940 [Catenulispora yoronensis]
MPLRDEAEAVAWFTAESANVLALTEAAASEHPAEIVALATAFYEFLRGRSQWGPAWTLNRLALAAARRTRDVRGEAATLLRGGVLQRYLGAFRDGEKDLMQAWEMYRTMDEPAAQAWALAEVGDVRRVLGSTPPPRRTSGRRTRCTSVSGTASGRRRRWSRGPTSSRCWGSTPPRRRTSVRRCCCTGRSATGAGRPTRWRISAT